MGVEGSGKTTIGMRLASRLGWNFVDGDGLHPAANVAKMAAGIPLTDEDRRPWIESIHALVLQEERQGKNLIVACSALKQAYRDVLNQATQVRWVYLKGSEALIRSRVEARKDHFAKIDLLASQFRDLQEPRDAIVIDIAQAPEEMVRQTMAAVGLDGD
jgi:gluconokinase